MKTENTAEKRGGEMMSMSMTKLPLLAIDYIKYLSDLYGFCGEVMMTGFCHYAQAVEGLKSNCDLYQIDQQGIDWFAAHQQKDQKDQEKHTQAYKVELLIIDFENIGAEEIKNQIENTKYSNRCISPSVMKCEGKDIGIWDDSHPLNDYRTMEKEYHLLFPSKSEIEESDITDTERLEFLIRFFRVDDTGDNYVCPGMIVDTDAVSESFDYGPLSDETVTIMGGWHNPDMRRVIDKAIANCRMKAEE